jgi:hypothetical protein
LGNELLSKNYGVYYTVESDNVQTSEFVPIRETEFDFSGASEVFGALPHSAAAVFDFSMLNRLTEDDTKYGYHFSDIKDRHRHIVQRRPRGDTLSDSGCFDILWLSPTEFLTCFTFPDGGCYNEKLLVEHLYTVTVCASGDGLSVQAYRLVPLENNVRTAIKSPSALPLRFMSQLLKPISDVVTGCNI